MKAIKGSLVEDGMQQEPASTAADTAATQPPVSSARKPGRLRRAARWMLSQRAAWGDLAVVSFAAAVLMATDSHASLRRWAVAPAVVSGIAAGLWTLGTIRRARNREADTSGGEGTGSEPSRRASGFYAAIIVGLCAALAARAIGSNTVKAHASLALALVLGLAVITYLLRDFGARVPRRILAAISGALIWLFVHVFVRAGLTAARRVATGTAAVAVTAAPIVLVLLTVHAAEAAPPSYVGKWTPSSFQVVSLKHFTRPRAQDYRSWEIRKGAQCGQFPCAYWLWDGYAWVWITSQADGSWTGSIAHVADCVTLPGGKLVQSNGYTGSAQYTFRPSHVHGQAVITATFNGTPTKAAAKKGCYAHARYGFRVAVHQHA